MIIWQDISINITNMLTLPRIISGPIFTFKGLDTKKLIVFFSLWGVSYFHHKPYTHDPQELNQLPTVTAKSLKQPITHSKEH